jgi:hypothetical protein
MNTLYSTDRSKWKCAVKAPATSEPQFHAPDLVSQVLERSLVLGCWDSNASSVSRFLPRRRAARAGKRFSVSTTSESVKKHRRSDFVPCVEPSALLKEFEAATGLQCRDDCYFNAVHRMKMNLPAGKSLRKVSPRLTIHPSIERTVSSHE